MDRSVMDAIRQQSDDLRDELKDLEQWEDQIGRKEEARRTRKVPLPASSQAIEPPVRGTVPSIKQAMAEEAKRQGKELPPEQDPIQLAKEKGNECFRLGKTTDAVTAYTQGIDLDPNSATTHVLYGNRAMCYVKLGEWAKAEKDATMCVQMNRGYAKGYFRRAVARKNLGKLKDARADLESVLALAPNDASAFAEMDEVTKTLQAQRSQTAAPAAKRRIIIEEVDDEDEEDEGGEMAEAVPTTPPSADDPARQARIRQQAADLESARQASEEAKQAEMLQAQRAMEARRRYNPRVEIIEEVEETPAEEPAPPPPAARHADPAPAVKVAEVVKVAAPVEVARKLPAAPRAAAAAPAPSVRARVLPTRDSLAAPKNFSEFERDFSMIESDEELRNYFVTLMDPAGLPALFGSNMTPEMLAGLLRSTGAMPAADAFRFLQGLSKVNRVGELALFFSIEEEKMVDELAAKIRADSGASAREVNAAVDTFKPL